MKILDSKVNKEEIIKKYSGYFKTLAKAVIDIEKGIIAIDAELHSDLEAYLIEKGSNQENLWGINIYPFKKNADFIEYTALINIRPHQNNRSMEIEDLKIREKIKHIVARFIDYEAL